MADAVKVGNSWVSQAALDYAKTQVNSDTQATLKDLSDRYPGVDFTTDTQPFSQKGINNIQIAPNILTEMKNNPDKKLEYEALIYDAAQLIYSGKMDFSGAGFHTKAAGTIINADGSFSGWSITEDDNDGREKNSVKLDKTKKDTWADKIHTKRKKKQEVEKKQETFHIIYIKTFKILHIIPLSKNGKIKKLLIYTIKQNILQRLFHKSKALHQNHQEWLNIKRSNNEYIRNNLFKKQC